MPGIASAAPSLGKFARAALAARHDDLLHPSVAGRAQIAPTPVRR